MNKIFKTINELYNKFLPIAEQSGVELNLDYNEPSDVEIDVETDDPKLKSQIEEQLKDAITRADRGQVKLQLNKGKLTISDTGTILSRPFCNMLQNNRVEIKSRVGFGTKVEIDLTKKPKDTVADQAEPKAINPATDVKSATVTKPAKSTKSTKTK